MRLPRALLLGCAAALFLIIPACDGSNAGAGGRSAGGRVFAEEAPPEPMPPPPAAAPAAPPPPGPVDPPAEEIEPEASTASPYRCQMPALPIPRPQDCARGRDYPRCKWQIPHALHSEGSWRRWRNTIPEHMYGRPALVAFVITAARELHRLHPEQILAIGDLDAPGPRHSTHDRGVDVDLYLPGALLVENAGGGRYLDNYEGKSEPEQERLRARVEELAKILAACSGGRLRIYYNDPIVMERFHGWFDAQGYASPFGRPMQAHNSLHDFHFHVTIAEDLPLLPSDPYETPPPVEPIAALPGAAQVAASDALSSRNRAASSAGSSAEPGMEPSPGADETRPGPPAPEPEPEAGE